VLHGAIASAATSGAMMGATAEQIESAIGMVVAHSVPFRAIRAGKQLSDSKGASAAISTEAAIVAVRRSMNGFIGPKDIFRNPEAVFCLFEKPKAKGLSPFYLVLSRAGADFSVMGMHFKLGLYEHQSAGALQALLDLLKKNPGLLEAADGSRIRSIKVVAYEPAYGIIGDPAKRDPRTRQSADHSMVYILATLLRKAIEQKTSDWATLMLSPYDYNEAAIMNPFTRALMEKITFEHGGTEYDRLYPEGIPTSLVITDDRSGEHDSGRVMFPTGHARNTTADLKALLTHKFKLLGALAVPDPDALVRRLSPLEKKSAAEVAELMNFEIISRGKYE
ncbi:MAG: MmgE/PrpD family protein, partial [Phycisphaerales bacterium]